MGTPSGFLNPTQAARNLGVSVKALRLYEQRGLVMPLRTASGWRAYGPAEMERAAEIVALRGLGFSLGQIGRVLNGDLKGMEQALVAHQATLESEMRELVSAVERVRGLRDRLAAGEAPTVGELARLRPALDEVVVAFDLPWPWGGERFELRGLKPLNYIIGPLFSGKTKLAQRLAETLPNAVFIGLERATNDSAWWQAQRMADPQLGSRVDETLSWLVEDGAKASEALIALLARLEAEGPDILVVDMVEQGLDEATQLALIAHLRRRGSHARPLYLMTRSRAILDLTAVGPNEAILFCPANHSPPITVAPHPGANGYEAAASCLASPEVRARSEGVIAWRSVAVG